MGVSRDPARRRGRLPILHDDAARVARRSLSVRLGLSSSARFPGASSSAPPPEPPSSRRRDERKGRGRLDGRLGRRSRRRCIDALKRLGGPRKRSAHSGGCSQTKTPMRPLSGAKGAQCGKLVPSAIQAGSRGAWAARASHSRASPVMPFSASSISAMRRQTRAVGRAAAKGASACRASANCRAASSARGARHPHSSCSGLSAASLAICLGALRRRCLRSEAEIGLGEIRVRHYLPGRLEDARRPSRPPLIDEHQSRRRRRPA